MRDKVELYLGSYNIPNRNGVVIMVHPKQIEEFKLSLPVPIYKNQLSTRTEDDICGNLVDVSYQLEENGVLRVYGVVEQFDHPSWDSNRGFPVMAIGVLGKVTNRNGISIGLTKKISGWDIDALDSIPLEDIPQYRSFSHFVM